MFGIFPVRITLLIGLLVSPVFSLAMTVTEVSPDKVGEIYIDETVTGEQIFLGSLQGIPHLYIVTFNEEVNVRLNLNSRAKDSDSFKFSIIVVRDLLPRGVEAVTRLRADAEEWKIERDTYTRVQYRQGPVFSETLPAGTYRIEISNPTNIGQYELRFGEVRKSTWWNKVKNMRALQRWYGTPWWQSLLSPWWYLPVSLLVGFLMVVWLIYRRYFRHV